MNKPSAARGISRLLFIQCLLIASVLVAFIWFSYNSVYNGVTAELENSVEICGRGMDDKLKSSDMLLERLIYKNNNYSLLQSDNGSVHYFAAIELSNLLQESVTNDIYADAVVIADSASGSLLDYRKSNVSHADRVALREFTMDKAELGSETASWQAGRIGEESFVYKLYIWDGIAVGVFMNSDDFMEDARSLAGEYKCFYLKDGGGELCTCVGKEDGRFLSRSVSRLLGSSELKISGFVSRAAVLSEIKFNLIAVALTLVILMIFTAVMVHSISTQVTQPISGMVREMEEIGGGDTEYRVREDYSSLEFSTLGSTVNSLMDSIMKLKIQSYEKQLALQETELRAVKLQIRPHFFLNAMTTISSLSQQGRNEAITTYIKALSKNIRYIFRSGLHTVSLEDEIAHVENYFEMQELKYPGCVFYSVEMMPGTERRAIPQMLLHTIIENEYKYAVSLDQVLSILIKAELVGELLQITVEDDGMGYPQDVLDAFESGSEAMRDPAEGKRIGLWSLRRMLELMYEREGLFRIENIEPHGCRNVFLLPEQPLHEVKELPQVKID